MEWVLLILGFILVFTGVLGSVLPVLPGPPISYAGLLILHFSSLENRIPGWILAVFACMVVLVLILDWVVPAWGTKKYGGSKWGVWGSTIGLFVGLFFGPLGVIFGPFAGAFVGEILNNRNSKDALRSAWGSFIGFLIGSGLKLLVSVLIMAFYVFKSFVAFGRLF